ncbi:MAG TPA: ABC transporter ATP-binding protein [Acidimicrobiales bacterium]|jgi:ABC-2 type transport system ATP-binding protein
MPTVQTTGLGKRYGSLWALQDCSVSVPPGRVTALVGPNGAGKTTLLKVLAGLIAPSTGAAAVLGRRPQQTSEFLDSIGFLAQEVPLYRRLSADDHLAVGARLNRHWDATGARARLATLRVPIDRPVATLSGGQRAQVGLSLALAKRPQLLLLDEPVAALDPLARREFLLSLTEAVADGNLSVILSSHLLHDLERVCDHLVLLAGSRTQICDDIEDVLAGHRMLVGPRRDAADVEPGVTVIKSTQTDRQTRLLVRVSRPILDPSWEIGDVGLEDIILAYMGRDDAVDPRSIPVLRGLS